MYGKLSGRPHTGSFAIRNSIEGLRESKMDYRVDYTRLEWNEKVIGIHRTNSAPIHHAEGGRAARVAMHHYLEISPRHGATTELRERIDSNGNRTIILDMVVPGKTGEQRNIVITPESPI